MSAELIHALAPPVLGLFFTCLLFLDERLILSKTQQYLQRAGSPAEVEERALRLVRGSIALATFLANALVFIANCLLAFLIYPVGSMGWRVSMVAIGIIVIVGIVYEIIWLFAKDVLDIAEHTLFGGTKTIDQWLRYEQICFNIFAVGYFMLGFALAGATPGHHGRPGL